jgi:hypothetical protein
MLPHRIRLGGEDDVPFLAGANYRRTASSNRGRARCYSIALVYKSMATNSGPKGLPQSASWIAVGLTAACQSKPCSNSQFDL